MDELSKTYAGKVDFQTVSYDTPEGVKLSDKYDVSGFPTFILLDADGRIVPFDQNSVKGQKITDDESYRRVYRVYLTSGLDKVAR